MNFRLQCTLLCHPGLDPGSMQIMDYKLLFDREYVNYVFVRLSLKISMLKFISSMDPGSSPG